jgi:anti-anti-sigma factor
MIGPYSAVLPLLRPDLRRPSDRIRLFISLAAEAADDRAGELELVRQDRPEAPALAGQPGQLAVEPSIGAGAMTIVLSGELDLTIAPVLTWHLARAMEKKPRRLVFDMARVDFLDCAIARLIVSMDGFLPEGQQPVIRCPSYAVRRILELTGFDDYCTVEAE